MVHLDSLLHFTRYCEGVALYHGKGLQPLLSSVDVRAFLDCRAHQCVPFFLRMYQTVYLATPNVSAISLMDFFFLFHSLRMACFNCIESSFDCMLWIRSNSFQMKTNT